MEWREIERDVKEIIDIASGATRNLDPERKIEAFKIILNSLLDAYLTKMLIIEE